MNDAAEQLRAALEEHQPARARIQARMEQRMSAAPSGGHRRRHAPTPWRRTVLAVLAAVAALTVGGLAVAAIVQPGPGQRVRVSAGPSPTEPPSATRSAAAGPTGAASTTPRSPEPSPGASQPGGTRVQDGPLWSGGTLDSHSNAYWAQSDLTLASTRQLTALTVQLRIVQTGGVRSTGNWQTLPAGDFTCTVQEQDGALVYRWILKPGRGIPPGRYVFAAQYDRGSGARSAGHDSYRVDAGAGNGAWAVWGALGSGL